MSVIYKYPLAPGKTEIEIPTDIYEVLSVGFQANGIVVWIKLDDGLRHGTHTRLEFTVIMTGEEFTVARDTKFIGTVTAPVGGNMGLALPNGVVMHVFGHERY